jgi:hypothetical protein
LNSSDFPTFLYILFHFAGFSPLCCWFLRNWITSKNKRDDAHHYIDTHITDGTWAQHTYLVHDGGRQVPLLFLRLQHKKKLIELPFDFAHFSIDFLFFSFFLKFKPIRISPGKKKKEKENLGDCCTHTRDTEHTATRKKTTIETHNTLESFYVYIIYV